MLVAWLLSQLVVPLDEFGLAAVENFVRERHPVLVRGRNARPGQDRNGAVALLVHVRNTARRKRSRIRLRTGARSKSSVDGPSDSGIASTPQGSGMTCSSCDRRRDWPTSRRRRDSSSPGHTGSTAHGTPRTPAVTLVWRHRKGDFPGEPRRRLRIHGLRGPSIHRFIHSTDRRRIYGRHSRLL